jgi:PIN domain nuclease of toxin-antitoxin system
LDTYRRFRANQSYSGRDEFAVIDGGFRHLRFEVSLLVKQRKLELPLPINEWLKEALTESGVKCLPVTCEISHLSVTLKDIHKDPADRIIIATSIIHDALLASVDSVFPDYPELCGRLIAR